MRERDRAVSFVAIKMEDFSLCYYFKCHIDLSFNKIMKFKRARMTLGTFDVLLAVGVNVTVTNTTALPGTTNTSSAGEAATSSTTANAILTLPGTNAINLFIFIDALQNKLECLHPNKHFVSSLIFVSCNDLDRL
jgi:hypothetical protein